MVVHYNKRSNYGTTRATTGAASKADAGACKACKTIENCVSCQDSKTCTKCKTNFYPKNLSLTKPPNKL